MKVAHDINVDGDAVVQGQGKFLSAILAPLVVASPILVSYLNSDLLDDKEGSYYLNVANHTGRITDFSRLPTVAENTLVGRYSSGTGDMQQITLGAGFSLPGGVLTYTETDPTVPAHVKGITSGNINNWNTAYGWGNYRQYGLGSIYYSSNGWGYTDLDELAAGDARATSFIGTNLSNPTGNKTGFTYPFGIHINVSSGIRGDLIISHGANRMAFRSAGRPFTEVLTEDNILSIGSGLFVNTTGNQSGIAGNKQWTGRQQWTFPANAGLVSEARSVQVAAGSNGPYVVGFDNNGNQIFTLRTYATSNIQLALNAGGISTPNHGTSANWYSAYTSLPNYVLKAGDSMSGNLQFSWGSGIQYGGGVNGTGGYIFGSSQSGSGAAGYGVWMAHNAFLTSDGTFIQPRGTLRSTLFTVNNHRGIEFLSAESTGTHGSEITPVRLVAISATGQTTITDLSGTGNGIVGVNSSGRLTRRPESDVIQTLSLGTSAGNIAISGGNSVSLSSLVRNVRYVFSIQQPGGFYPFNVNSSGIEGGYPGNSGTGFVMKYYVADNANYAGSFAIFKGSSNDGKLHFNVGAGTTDHDWKGWETFASEEWTASNYYSKTESDGRYLSALTVNGENYLTIDSGSKTLTAGAINLNSTHTSGVLPVTKGGTGLSSLGSPGQFLRVNGAGNALEYYSLPSPVVPDLQSVTDQGAVTSNDITIEKAGSISSILVRESISGAFSAVIAYGSTAQIRSTNGTYVASFIASSSYARLYFQNSTSSDQWSLQYISDSVATLGIGDQLRVPQDPIHNDDLTRKAYVDNLVKDGTLTLSTGDGLTGSASFSANQSTNSTFTVGLSAATNTTIGGVKLFSNTVQSVAANAVTSTASRTYGVQVNSSGQLVVNVPWTDNNTTYSGSNGISLSGTVFSPVYGTTAGTIAEGNHVHSIQQLTDVDYMVVADGDVLAYDGIDGIWKPLTLPAFPTNYVTTNTNQSSLGGNKTWTGHHIIAPSTTSSPVTVANSVRISRNSNGAFVTIENSSAVSALTLRSWNGGADNKYQISLLTGGIETGNHGNSENWYTAWSRIDSSNLGKTGNGIIANNTTLNSEQAWTDLPIGYSAFVYSNVGVANGAPDNTLGYFTKVANRDVGGGWGGLWIDYNYNAFYVGKAHNNTTFATWSRVLTAYTPTTLSSGQLLQWNGTGWTNWTPNFVSSSTTISAGNGLTGGGALSGNVTVTLGTPGNITLGSSNSVSTNSHTHAFVPGGTASQYIRGDGTLATFPAIPTNYVTTNTNQSSLSGTKDWTSAHSWTLSSNVVPVGAAGRIAIGKVTSGVYMQAYDNDGNEAFALRAFSASGYQLSLGKGGVETATHGNSSQWNAAYGWGNHASAGYVPQSRVISAGTGLTGGGNLTADRTISVNFGTAAGTVAQGNDSRINNGQTAYGWGNHASAGYVPGTRTLQFTAGSGLSVSGTASTNLSVDRTVTYSLTFGTTAGTVAQGNDSRIVNAVQTSRSINTQHSITGGGNLGSDRTFQLVNDVSSPGANKYYGTNNANVRGWYDLPSTSSFVPTSRTITINGNTQNLTSNRSWTVGDVTGSGQAFTVPLWGGSGSSSKIISNSIMVQDAGRIIVGGNLKVDLGLEVTQTTTLNSSLNVNGVAIFNDIAAFNGFVNMDNSSTQVSAGNLRINGLRSTEITLVSSPGAANADTTLYNVFRMNYSSNGAGIQLTGTPKDGSIAILVSQNDTNSFTIRNTVRGSSAVTFSGGTCVLLVRAGSYWYIVGTHDNNW